MDATKPMAPVMESELERLYAQRFNSDERKTKARLWKANIDGFFHRFVPAEGTVVDLGAGYCEFINQVQAARRIAVDVNPESARAAASGVESIQLPLERLDEGIAPASVDLAFASNVFEHLRNPESLLAVLTAVFRVLKPGGRLIVLQPNIRAVGTAFWDFFDHTLPLTEKGMVEAFGVVGFGIEEVRPRFLPYTTKSRIPKWPILVRVYLALPPLHWIFGQQMLVVGRKP